MQTDGRTATYGRRETTLIGYAPAPSTPQATIYEGESEPHDSAAAEPPGEPAENLAANLAGALAPAPATLMPQEEVASPLASPVVADERERPPALDAVKPLPPGERRNPASRRLPINRGRHLSRAFFEEGERQEQTGWENSPLAADASLSGSGELAFSSFDRLPRRRAPMIALAVGATAALVVVGALTFGGRPTRVAVSSAPEVKVVAPQPAPVAVAPAPAVVAAPVPAKATAPVASAPAAVKAPPVVTAAAPVKAPPAVTAAAPVKSPSVVTAAAPVKSPPVVTAAAVTRAAPVSAAAPVKSPTTAPAAVKAVAPVKAPSPAVANGPAGKAGQRAFTPTADAKDATKSRAQAPRVVGPAVPAKTGRQAASARRPPVGRPPVANTVPPRLRMKSPPAPAQAPSSPPAAAAAVAPPAAAGAVEVEVEVNKAPPAETSAPAEPQAPAAPAAAAPVELPPASAAPAAAEPAATDTP